MAPTMMKQWTTEMDGLDKLKLGEAERPSPKDGEVLVKIQAVALNYRDTEVCSGEYNHHKSLDDNKAIVPCSDMCGTVVESKSPEFAVGTRVMATFNQTHLTGQIQESDMASGLGFPQPGVLTEYRCFPATGLVAVPEYLKPEEAACLPIASVTAWMAINGMRPAGELADGRKKHETVLLQGTGGVAVAGLQIARAAGLKTIVTSSSDDKLKKARDDLGAEETINYRTHWDWQSPVMEATGGKGADIIFETGGARTLRKSFDCVAFGGLINCIGYLSGKGDEDEGAPGSGSGQGAGGRLNVNVMALRRNVTLKGILNGPRDRFQEMCRFYDEHKIRPVVDRVFKMDEADEALRYLQSGGHFGKVVVKVAE